MMKTIVWIFLMVFLFPINVLAQNNSMPYAPEVQLQPTRDGQSNLEFTIGYIPKSSVQALKTSFSVNNILCRRFGVYTSMENGLVSRSFSNTVGITTSIHHFVYFWGGMDLLTKRGFIQNKALNGTRKEMGIGITPYKWYVVRVGWSSSVGFTITAGMRIPL